MAFTDAQQTWLETAQNKSAEFVKAGKTMEEKSAKLEDITAQVEALREDLTAANQALKIEWTKESKMRFGKAVKKSMDWMNGDLEKEVDTKHDVRDGVFGTLDIDPEAAKKVQDLHAKLVKIQSEMEKAKGSDDKALFTAKDIQRELWSPLIQADVIPSNAVADKYSQEAQVFNEACELYESKLEEFTKTASRHDTAKQWIGVLKDATTTAGAVVSNFIAYEEAENLGISRDDASKYKALSAQNVTADANAAEGSDARFMADYLDKASKGREARLEIAKTSLAVAAINGALSVADASLAPPDPKKGWAIAEVAFDSLNSAAIASIDTAQSSIGTSNPDLAFRKSFKTKMAAAKNIVNAGFKGAKIAFRISEIAMATDPKGRENAAKNMITALAGAIECSFAAVDKKTGKDPSGDMKGGTDSHWAKIGSYVSTAIQSSANAALIAREVKKAYDSGSPSNLKSLGAAVGMTAIAPIMAGVLGGTDVSDAHKKDVDHNTSDGIGVFEETAQEKIAREEALGSVMAQITSTSSSTAQSILDAFPPDQKTSEDKQEKVDEITDEVADKKLKDKADDSALIGDIANDAKARQDLLDAIKKREDAEKKQALSEFSDKVKDKAARKEFENEITARVEKRMDAFKDLVKDASPSDDDLADEETSKKAMEAIDKLIKEAAELNAKWKMLDTLTAGGTSVLVAALPVAGLAQAIQKLVADVVYMLRKSSEVNTWLKSKALTKGNSSVYGTAIKNRLGSASVQVSQQAVRVIFDSVGVGVEVAKLADVTGVATAVGGMNNMAKALAEQAYKVQKEATVRRGWKLYKKARATPGDRKAARKAMAWNSTLSKCVLAYGIVMDGDPIAKEVARKCGLTPEILADQKDVCQKVVTYFQTLYSDDPEVMRRIPVKQDWHPGSPTVSLNSWLRFKAAGADRAKPVLAPESTNTPAVDKQLALLKGLIGDDGDYVKAHKDKYPDMLDTPKLEAETRTAQQEEEYQKGYQDFLKATDTALADLISALKGYNPQTGVCPDDIKEAKDRWLPGLRHEGMEEVIDSLIAQATMMRAEVNFDSNRTSEREKMSLDDLVAQM